MSYPFHIVTPLLQSPTLSEKLGLPVFLKMDALQPTGSFKIRGLGSRIEKILKQKPDCQKLIASSGGNAGLAVAYCAKQLKLKATIVVPETTPEFMRKRIEREGATVLVHGSEWSIANELAMEMATRPGSAFIHPFDHPDIWAGNASVITECASQMREKPGVVICVCGGGGLMVGVLEGMVQSGWLDVPLIVSETQGAHSFNLALSKGEIIPLDRISSIAKSLGAKEVCVEAFKWKDKHEIRSMVVTDLEAVEACYEFGNDHRILVEPACGAGLALVYNPERWKVIMDEVKPKSVLVIVCGGNMVTIEMLKSWKDVLQTL